MKCLVTGGAGFIGSHIVDLLIENNHEVVVVDNLLTGNKKNLNSKAIFYEVDICDKEELDKIFLKENLEIVFHVAAQVDVTKSIKNPLFDAKINILGSLNILELCRVYRVKKIIYSNSGGAGSGEPQYIPIDENHPIKPISHYGISKHIFEHYLEVYRYLYGLKYVSLRYANIYGPRQDPYGEGGVVAIFANKILNDKQPKIFGDGNQTRDFMYVRDVAKVNLLCINKLDNKILNVGTGVEVTVNELFLILKKIINSDLEPIHTEKREGDIYRSVFNINKLKEELLWEPKINLNEGLRKTVEYFRKV